ncbi:MAG: helix-turn-helix domain-containing protein [Actinomycetia bacterium]|nr:helix-turn-helix domain-containing protein [Actinomycetes bacterium]
MSAGLAGVLPAAARFQEDDIDEPYLWSDLLARRNALGLRVEDIVPALRVDKGKYHSRETGSLKVSKHLVDELIAMEEFVASQTEQLLAAAPAEGIAVLHAVTDQGAFESAYPDARTLRDLVAYPVALQYVAVGRAAAELSRRGRDVEVRRGDRRADLVVRRLATGLLKDETARLLGVSGAHYAKFERGTSAPPAGLLAELQAIDDFIATTAADLEVTEANDVSVVMVPDDDGFERAYPQARTRRDNVPYPRRVLRVAAGRRAHALEAAGPLVRIAVVN